MLFYSSFLKDNLETVQANNNFYADAGVNLGFNKSSSKSNSHSERAVVTTIRGKDKNSSITYNNIKNVEYVGTQAQDTKFIYNNVENINKTAGEVYNPRHHGVHYHLEYKVDLTKSWNNKNNVHKLYPNGYTNGSGSGFLPGEAFPNKKRRKTKMEWINVISNRDARVSKININNLYVTLEIECWNGELRKINFKNYHIVKEKNSIGEEIGDIKIEVHSSLIEELKQDILNGGGTLNEINDIKHFIFYDSWNNRVILEILAEITEYI